MCYDSTLMSVASAHNGDGVAEILRGPIVTEGRRVYSARWQIVVGTDPAGAEVAIPASQVNILVSGASGSGKSYTAGLLAEELIALGYDMLVFDPEGDYATLAELPGVVILGEHAIPEPDDLIAFLHRRGSLVVDLSAHSPERRDEFMSRFAPLLAEFRDKTGRPDWVLIDEAQVPYGQNSPLTTFYQPSLYSHLVVTYQFAQLDEQVRESIDITLTPRGDNSTVLVSRKGDMSPGLVVRIANRQLGHLRHEHKYSAFGVPAERGFWFRDGRPANGKVAHNLEELRRMLPTCSDNALRHHASGRDFSRWVDKVLGDHDLAAEMATVEPKIQGAEDSARLRQASGELETLIAESIRNAEPNDS